jgi:hypothetical protein
MPDSILPRMTDHDAAPPESDRDARRRLAPLFLAIAGVEAVTIALLWWFGRHFS